jgi:hypothetical protein
MARDPLNANAQALIARCRAIDWCRPQHDPRRAAFAYRRWLAQLGLKRRIKWIADPADVASWQAQAAGMVGAWGALAATNPAGSSVIGLLDGTAPAWLQAPAGDALVAANWAFVVNLHVATFENTSDLWFSAWRELAAREPALALAAMLLSPPFQWPAPGPATIALAAPGAVAACTDARAWESLAEAVTGPRREGAEEEAFTIPFAMPTPAELIDALVSLAEPMVEACEAGAFAHALRSEEILVLAAPEIWTDDGRLHRADGPALAWPRTRAGAWKGFLLPEGFVIAPETITPAAICAVTGPLRHALLDICACARCHCPSTEDGAAAEHEDCTGRLWRQTPTGHRAPSSDFRMAEARNGAPDMRRKRRVRCGGAASHRHSW